MKSPDPVTEKIIGAAFAVHNALGAGFVEKVYENALAIELRALGLGVVQQAALKVKYKGAIVGDFVADFLVDERIILEIKAVRSPVVEHELQLVNYLSAVDLPFGLLINFGKSVTVKRKYAETHNHVNQRNPANPV